MQSYYSSEIFLDSYTVLRKDHIKGAGGVFVCVRKQFNVTELNKERWGITALHGSVIPH